MTFENTPPPEEPKGPVYNDTDSGIRAAAEEYKSRQPETAEVKVEGTGENLTPRAAGEQLAKHRERSKAELAAVQAVLASDDSLAERPQPTDDDAPDSDVRMREAWQQYEGETQQQAQQRQQQHAEQALQEGAVYHQQAQLESQRIAQYQQQLAQEFQTRFPDITSPDDLNNLAQYDPDRALSAVQYLQSAEAAVKNATEAAHGKAALAQQSLNVWQAEQDRIFAEAHPEITQAARGPLAKAALKVLKDEGLSDEDIRHHWQNGQLRNAAVQGLVYKAAKYELAQQGVKRAVPKAPTPVVRPGRGGADTARIHGERAASDRLDQTGSAKDAARLWSIQRRGR